MTRILVQRGGSASAAGSSSNATRNCNASLPGSSSARVEPSASPPSPPQALSAVKDEEIREEVQEQVVLEELLEFSGTSDNKAAKSDDLSVESFHNDQNERLSDEIVDSEKDGSNESMGLGELRISDMVAAETEGSSGDSPLTVSVSSYPPPPPVPPPKPSAGNSNTRRFASGNSNPVHFGPSRRAVAWPVVSTRTSPTGSRPSSPRSHGENEGYNSADEQNPCFVSSYDDIVSCGIPIK